MSPEVEHSWEVSFNQGDANAVAALYAADAQLVMSGAALIRGVTDMCCAIEEETNSGVKARIYAEQNVGAGGIAYVYGTFPVLRSERGPEVERGAYAEVRRRRGGGWKIEFDVNAPGVPIAATAALDPEDVSKH